MTTEDEYCFRELTELNERGFSMEEKIVLASEEDTYPVEMSDYEIREIVEGALAALPFDFEEEEVGAIYDALYEVVLMTLERAR